MMQSNLGHLWWTDTEEMKSLEKHIPGGGKSKRKGLACLARFGMFKEQKGGKLDEMAL